MSVISWLKIEQQQKSRETWDINVLLDSELPLGLERSYGINQMPLFSAPKMEVELSSGSMILK